MSLMIPSIINSNVKSSAESKIFNLLKNETEGWVCIHSLDLAEHQYKICGEIDFVLLSSWGILCLEVKGGQIKRNDGVWLFTDRYGRQNKKRESPFNQAMSGAMSLKENIIKQFGDSFRGFRIGHGVLFPDIEFEEHSPEWSQEVIYDIRDSKREFSLYLLRLCNHWKQRIKGTNRDIDEINLEELKSYLRGNFEKIVPIWKKVADSEDVLITLTKEQYRALDRMHSNKRILFKGAAGTGKTLLALEQARRNAFEDKKVLLLCFNALLGSFLNIKINDFGITKYVTATNIHEYFSSVINNGPYKDEFRNDFGRQMKSGCKSEEIYYRIFPFYFIKTVSNSTLEKFDCIIIDEGQDIMRDEMLICIDLILKDGLEKGCWYVFFDPNNQVEMYHNYDEKSFLKLKGYGASEYALDINCRNTRPIAIQTALISEFSMADTLCNSGPEVEYYWYLNESDELRILKNIVHELLAQNINPKDITILYPGGADQLGDVISKKFSVYNLNLERIIDVNNKLMLLSSIQSYKGLENKVIILVGIDKFDGNWVNTLNYVGMSRARSLLYIIADERMKPNYFKKIDKFLS